MHIRRPGDRFAGTRLLQIQWPVPRGVRPQAEVHVSEGCLSPADDEGSQHRGHPGRRPSEQAELGHRARQGPQGSGQGEARGVKRDRCGCAIVDKLRGARTVAVATDRVAQAVLAALLGLAATPLGCGAGDDYVKKPAYTSVMHARDHSLPLLGLRPFTQPPAPPAVVAASELREVVSSVR
jgi:hypothetical protein